MFKREPSKVFMNEEKLLLMKVTMQVHPGFLLITGRTGQNEVRLIVPKTFALVEEHQYRLILNNNDFDDSEDGPVYSYSGENVFQDSFFRVNNTNYKFHSGFFDLKFPSAKELSISFQALLEKDGTYSKAWFQLHPLLNEIDTGLSFDFSGMKIGSSTRSVYSENEVPTLSNNSKPISEITLEDFEEYPIWIYDFENEDSPGQDETWITPWLDTEIPQDDFITVVSTYMGDKKFEGIANLMLVNQEVDLYSLDIEIADQLVTLEELLTCETTAKISLRDKVYVLPESKSLKLPIKLFLQNEYSSKINEEL